MVKREVKQNRNTNEIVLVWRALQQYLAVLAVHGEKQNRKVIMWKLNSGVQLETA